ncbi:mucin-4 [Mugil cephalus]|uniref:mucin-4 n=1 Tax=Mugil cephalus TaxID=48193 RepID=UPI001FB85E22|nr:mucin-4 [Mugil cephalus]
MDNSESLTPKANFTLEINKTYSDVYDNFSSPETLQFIHTLKQELDALCKKANPQAYKTVKIIKLSPGSILAENVVEYRYLNNDTEIHIVNTQLEKALSDILNDSRNLHNISQALGNVRVQLKRLTFEAPNISNILDLRSFISCSRFANYTAEIIDDQWQCTGPCKKNPNYCHQHGECHNDINRGPICTCYENSLEQFYGSRCESFRRGPGFYGALFGSLAGAILLLIVIITIVIITTKRHASFWKKSHSFNRRLSAFEEDFFDFSGAHNFGPVGSYRSRPNDSEYVPQMKSSDQRM